jgi:hypothetical protein
MFLISLAFALAGGCGTGNQSASGAPSTSTVLARDLTVVRVAAGATNGWVYGTTDGSSFGLFRYGTGDSFTKTADLPNYRSPFATVSRSGELLVGGVRCVNVGCHSWRAEVTRFDRNGSRRGVTILEMVDTPPDDTTSIGLLGRVAGGIAVATDRGIVSVSDGGHLSTIASGPLPGSTCAVDGDLYAVTRLDQDAGSVVRLPADGEPQRVAVSIDKLVGTEWKSVTNGQLSVELPAPANVYCGHDQLLAISSDVAQGHWTPVDGWTMQPNSATPDRASNTASTGSWYGLDEHGTLARRDPSGSPKTLQFAAPQADAVPASIKVDDSGGALFACVLEPTATVTNEDRNSAPTQCGIAV